MTQKKQTQSPQQVKQPSTRVAAKKTTAIATTKQSTPVNVEPEAPKEGDVTISFNLPDMVYGLVYAGARAIVDAVFGGHHGT